MSLYERLSNGEEKLAVVGLGYVRAAPCRCICQERIKCNRI